MTATADIPEGIFACFNLEHLRLLQQCAVQPFDFRVAIPRRRIAWVDMSPANRRQPAHASAFVYRGPEPNRFRALFGDPGWRYGGRVL